MGFTDLKRSTIEHFVRLGIITPQTTTNGTGHPRGYDVANLRAMRVARELLVLGITGERLCRLMAYLQDSEEWARAQDPAQRKDFAVLELPIYEADKMFLKPEGMPEPPSGYCVWWGFRSEADLAKGFLATSVILIQVGRLFDSLDLALAGWPKAPDNDSEARERL